MRTSYLFLVDLKKVPRSIMTKKWIRPVFLAVLITTLIHILYALFLKPKSDIVPTISLPERDVSHKETVISSNVGLRTCPDGENDFRLIVMTFNRAEALTRCLQSLNDVDYDGDKVHVDIWIDRSKKDGSIDNKTFTAASMFQFKHGTVKVNMHPEHVGLFGQWLSTWVPKEDTCEIAFFVEDDLTISRHAYKWLKLVHKKYDSLPYINGFSTQGKSIKHGSGGLGLHGPEHEIVFSYPVLGSWGFSPKPKHWLKFLAWFEKAHSDPAFKPLVPGLIVSKWYEIEIKRGRTDSMWTMWHVYYANLHKELTVYPNLPGKMGFAINWEEPGLHYKGSRKTVNNDPIVVEWDDRYADLPEEPVQLNTNGVVVKPSVRKTR